MDNRPSEQLPIEEVLTLHKFVKSLSEETCLRGITSECIVIDPCGMDEINPLEYWQVNIPCGKQFHHRILVNGTWFVAYTPARVVVPPRMGRRGREVVR